MKKYTTSLAFRTYNNRRLEDRQRRNAGHERRLAKRNRSINHEKKQEESRKTVTAPDIFSFIDNPNDVCSFINELESLYASRTSVFVNLSNVSSMDHSAVTLMLSTLVRFKSANIYFNGNYPSEKNLYKPIKRIVGTLYNKKFGKQDEYKIHKSKGYEIYTHAKKNVDSALAWKLIGNSAEQIWGEVRRCKGVQSSLIELMHNTHNHADRNGLAKRHWWLSISYDSSKQSASFVFVDFGIGIFDSLNNKPVGNQWTTRWNNLKARWGNDATLLSKILAGEMHATITGKSYRGKGLPHIAKAADDNKLSNLCVISNNAYCNYSSNKVMNLNKSFSGTMIHWEININNENER